MAKKQWIKIAAIAAIAAVVITGMALGFDSVEAIVGTVVTSVLSILTAGNTRAPRDALGPERDTPREDTSRTMRGRR